MTHPRSTNTTTVAILGPDTIVEGILARLLHKEGYATRLLDPNPTRAADELLEGVDALLLTPGLDAEMSGPLFEAMRSNPKTAAIPVLPLPAALKLAMLDELSASAPWQSLFDELVGQIGAALQRAAASAGAFLVDGGEAAAQPDAP
jgi:hypothetical protein